MLNVIDSGRMCGGGQSELVTRGRSVVQNFSGVIGEI
jgi:hypothetical protein